MINKIHKYIKLCLGLLIISGLFSCSPGGPYEVKSPCVSYTLESHPHSIVPCPRRAINSDHLFA